MPFRHRPHIGDFIDQALGASLDVLVVPAVLCLFEELPVEHEDVMAVECGALPVQT
jgi:hypothetical protein